MSERDDLEYLEHARIWRGFTRLMIATVVAVAATLILMAMFLL